jgi:hypothetical protein
MASETGLYILSDLCNDSALLDGDRCRRFRAFTDNGEILRSIAPDTSFQCHSLFSALDLQICASDAVSFLPLVFASMGENQRMDELARTAIRYLCLLVPEFDRDAFFQTAADRLGEFLLRTDVPLEPVLAAAFAILDCLSADFSQFLALLDPFGDLDRLERVLFAMAKVMTAPELIPPREFVRYLIAGCAALTESRLSIAQGTLAVVCRIWENSERDETVKYSGEKDFLWFLVNDLFRGQCGETEISQTMRIVLKSHRPATNIDEWLTLIADMIVSGNSRLMAAVAEFACRDLGMDFWTPVLGELAGRAYRGMNEILAVLSVISHVRRAEDVPAIWRILENMSESATGCYSMKLYDPFMDFALKLNPPEALARWFSPEKRLCEGTLERLCEAVVTCESVRCNRDLLFYLLERIEDVEGRLGRKAVCAIVLLALGVASVEPDPGNWPPHLTEFVAAVLPLISDSAVSVRRAILRMLPQVPREFGEVCVDWVIGVCETWAEQGEVKPVAEIAGFARRCIEEWGIDLPPVVLAFAE